MKYSTWIIILSLLNPLIVFSGIPTGTKKVIIIITCIGLLFIALILRAIEKRQAERLLLKKKTREEQYTASLETVIEEIAEDIQEQVVEKLSEITHQENIIDYDKRNTEY